MAVSGVLGALVVSGLMGMVGQGARTIVGLKKIADLSSAPPSQSDLSVRAGSSSA